jgi:hypothetical protein
MIAESESRLAAEAFAVYDKGQFGDAARKFEQLTRKFDTSGRVREYQFMRALAATRDRVALSDLDDALRELVDFHKEYKDDPLLQARSREVGETLLDAMKGVAKQTTSDPNRNARELLDHAEKAFTECDGQNRAGLRATERDEVAGLLKKARDVVALAELRLQFLDQLKALSDKPSIASLRGALALRDQALRENRPWAEEAGGFLKTIEGGLTAQMKYTPIPPMPANVKGILTDEAAPTILMAAQVRAPTRVIGARDQVVFALARGVLYALNQDGGKPRWCLRVGIDTTALPVRLPATAARGERVLVQSADTKLLLALDVLTGATDWTYALTAPCVGRPVVVEQHLYVPTRDGKVHEIGIESGKLLGLYDLGKDVLLNFGASFDGANQLYLAGDEFCVYVLDLSASGGSILFTEHPRGSLLCSPVARNGYAILTQADGIDQCRLRAFPLSSPSSPLELEPIDGWPWFPTTCDGEKVAVVTDDGALGLYGMQMQGNLDRALFPLLTPDKNQKKAPTARNPNRRRERAQIVHSQGDALWTLSDGKLQKYQLTLHRHGGQKLVPQWKEPLLLGSPLHESQVWRQPLALANSLESQADEGAEVLFLVTQSLDGQTYLATAVDAQEGQVLWQRQLGLVCQGDPLVLGREVLTLDQSAGLYSFDALLDAVKKDAQGAESQWILTGRTAAKPLEGEGGGVPPLLLRNPDGQSALEIACPGKGNRLFFRQYQPSREIVEFHEQVPAPLAGTPAIVGKSLVVGLADGNLRRYNLPLGTAGHAGPHWRARSADRDTICHIVALTDDYFLTTNGGRGLVRWRWPAGGMFSALPPGRDSNNPTVQAPARIVSAPAVLPADKEDAGLRIAVADANGGLTLFDSNLRELQHWDLPGKVTSGPFARGRHIGCIVEQRLLVWLEPGKQKPLWVFEWQGAHIVGQPAEAGGMLVVALESGLFLGIDPATGKHLGDGYTLRASVAPSATPVPFGPDRVFAPLTDGTVLLLSLKRLKP